MPKFYKGEWVHFVHFNQFPKKRKRRANLQFGGGSQKLPIEYEPPRKETPAVKAHREKMRRLFKDYDEWPEEVKESWLKDVE